VPIEGPLRELGIQDVLQMLDLARKTGVLTVRSQRMMDEAVVHLVDGELVFASRRRSMRLLGQQLLRDGKLTDAELEQALELQRGDPRRPLGAILIEMGSMDRSELHRQLRFQIEETIYDLLSWDEGYFRFEESDETPDSAVRVQVDSLLMEGARRIDEWARLESRVPSPEAVPALAPAEPGRGVMDLRPEEWEILAEVDGERDLRNIASDMGRSVFDVAKIVYGLAAMNVLRVLNRPPPTRDEEFLPLLDDLELLLADGRPDEAHRRARDLQKTYTDRAELPLLVGRALAAQGRTRAAAEALERAVALDPLSLDAHYHLGLAAVRSGDLDRANEAWSTFLRLTRDGGSRRRPVERAVGAMTELKRAIEAAPTE
jgi:tetratricopeptide (TPR) repeat protein